MLPPELGVPAPGAREPGQEVPETMAVCAVGADRTDCRPWRFLPTVRRTRRPGSAGGLRVLIRERDDATLAYPGPARRPDRGLRQRPRAGGAPAGPGRRRGGCARPYGAACALALPAPLAPAPSLAAALASSAPSLAPPAPLAPSLRAPAARRVPPAFRAPAPDLLLKRAACAPAGSVRGAALCAGAEKLI